MSLKAQVEAPVGDIHVNGNVRLGELDLDAAFLTSIAQHGIIEPLVVAGANDGFDLIAGHRRLAAALELGLETVPIHIRFGKVEGANRIGIQVSENMHRQDLTTWELAQAALDLKDEGLKQADVAKQMGIAKSDVSSLQKIARLDLDAERGNQLSASALLGLVEVEKQMEIPASDIARQIIEEGARDVRQAVYYAQDELAAVAALDELAVLQKEWAELGVVVLSEDPKVIPGEEDQYGYPKKNPNVVLVEGWNGLGIDLEDHITEPCHGVWVTEGQGRTSMVSWTHYCLDKRRHGTKGESEVKVSKTQNVGGGLSDKEKEDRRKDREAKKLRFRKAGEWLQSSGNKARRYELALAEAVTNIRQEQVRTIVLALIEYGQIEKRPTGASPSWYDTKLNEWMDEHIGDDELKRDEWQLMAYHAAHYIDSPSWSAAHRVKDEIDAVEVSE